MCPQSGCPLDSSLSALTRRAIRSMGEIAMKVANAGKQAVGHFLEFLDMEMDFVRGSCTH